MERRLIQGQFSAPALLVIWAFAVTTLLVAIYLPFPTSYDELQHFSVIRAQYEHPTVFPDPRTYFVVRQDDPTQWSATRNYINHPSLYYLLISIWLPITDNVVLLRLINVALAVATMVVLLWAAIPRFVTRFDQASFAILAASFPKAAVIGGMINNDNLAGLAGAVVFAGMMRASGWMLGLGLALAGWTKLTAFIALGVVVAGEQGWRWWRHGERRGAELLPILVGAVIGLLPYIVSVIQTGHLLQVNDQVFGAAVGQRPALDLGAYTSMFFRAMTMKWGASEYALPFGVVIALLAIPLGLAAIGIVKDRTVARPAIVYLVAITVTLAIHFCFGWSEFKRIGDQTIAQTRYYNLLWPGVALAAAAGVAILDRISRVLSLSALALCIAPTIVGCAVLAIVTG